MKTAATLVQSSKYTITKSLEFNLPYINQIEIPRYVGINPDTTFDIYGFSGASLLAYGCCIYTRVTTPKGFDVRLFIAKSRVASVIQQSLIRFELSGTIIKPNLR